MESKTMAQSNIGPVHLPEGNTIVLLTLGFTLLIRLLPKIHNRGYSIINDEQLQNDKYFNKIMKSLKNMKLLFN